MGGGASKSKPARLKPDPAAPAQPGVGEPADVKLNPDEQGGSPRPPVALELAKAPITEDSATPQFVGAPPPAESLGPPSEAGGGAPLPTERPATVWEEARRVMRSQLVLPPTPALAADMAVVLHGVEGQPMLEGTGATLIEPTERGGWRVQSESAAKPPFEVAAASLTPLPPLPKDGVSLECLRSFRKAHPELFYDDGYKTTTDACLQVIMPMTKSARTSLAAVLKHIGAAEDGRPFVAPATVFVSHAWRYRVVDIFDAMEAFAARQESPASVYFWFDLFVNDQHDAISLPQLWWREAFLDGVRAIGHTCLVLAPWHDPIPLTRAWCLWEILSTMRLDAQLTVQMVPREAESFGRALEEDFEHVDRAVSNIDGRRAEAFQKSDQRMIISAVLETVGFTELNALISSRMREWLIEQARGYAALERIPPQDRGKSRLLHNLGRLLHEQRHMESAEKLMLQAVTASSADDDPIGYNTLSRKNNLARLYRGMERLDEAEALFREVLLGYKELEARDGVGVTVDSITTMNNLAELQLSSGRAAEAEPMLNEALHAARSHLDKMDENVYLTILNNLASILEQRGELTAAEALFQEALDARKKSPKFGARHPTTLLVSTNLANVYKKHGKMNEAEKMYREALATKQETLGEHHESTLKSMNNLAVFLIEQKKLKDAIPMLREAFEGYSEAMGLQHPDTITLVRNYAQVLYSVGQKDESLKLLSDVLEHLEVVHGKISDAQGLATTYATLLAASGDMQKLERLKSSYVLE